MNARAITWILIIQVAAVGFLLVAGFWWPSVVHMAFGFLCGIVLAATIILILEKK